MTAIVFVHPQGQRQELEVLPGQTVMQIATAEGINGILAECGGSCSCATCHVYVDPAWAERLPKPTDFEQAALEGVLEPRATSRLCCQIDLTPELEGMVIHVPERQL